MKGWYIIDLCFLASLTLPSELCFSSLAPVWQPCISHCLKQTVDLILFRALCLQPAAKTEAALAELLASQWRGLRFRSDAGPFFCVHSACFSQHLTVFFSIRLPPTGVNVDGCLCLSLCWPCDELATWVKGILAPVLVSGINNKHSVFDNIFSSN